MTGTTISAPDTTDWKRRYQDLWDNAVEGLFRNTLEGRPLAVNPALARILGYDGPDQVLAEIERVADIYVDARDRERMVEALQRDGEIHEVEARFVRRDGTHVWLSFSARLIRDGDGQPIQLEGMAVDVSDRKHAEQQLELAARQFRAAFDEAPTGMAIVALDGSWREVNRELCRIVGRSADELTAGMTFQDVTHPDDLDTDLAYVRELLDGERDHYTMPKRYRRPDGTTVPVELYGSVVRDDDGRPAHFIAQVRDVSGKQVAAHEIARRQELLAAVSDAAEMLLRSQDWQATMDAVLARLGSAAGAGRASLLVNEPGSGDLPVFARTHSWSAGPDPLAGDPRMQSLDVAALGLRDWGERLRAGEVVHGPLHAFADHERQVLAAFGVSSIALVPILVDGTWWGTLSMDDDLEAETWSAGQIDVLRAAADIVGGAVARAEATTQLAASEERLQRLVETTPIGLVFVDPDGRISFANSGAERMLRLDRSAITGRTYDDPDWQVEAVDGGPFPVDELPFAVVRRTGAPVVDVRHTIAHPDGARTVLSINAAPLTVDGDFAGMVAALTDVTAQLEYETARERYSEELEQSNRELEQFAYVASHDLQEPLRMVSSFLQLLQARYGDQLDETADEWIGFAVDGASRMQGLIHDLLAYSRVGTRGRDPQPVDARAVTDRVLHDLAATIEDARARIVVDDLPLVLADDAQLGQLLQNLVVNALKFRGDDAPVVALSARPDEPGWWRLTVRDNGIGIAPEHHERIFDIFRRLHTRDEYSGTGIGLAICRKIVDRHGGDLWVDSAPGAGSSFHFTLPAASEMS